MLCYDCGTRKGKASCPSHEDVLVCENFGTHCCRCIMDALWKPNNMHVYGQNAWHDPVVIVGDTESLKRLRDAVDAALATGGGKLDSFVGADGEGYRTVVLRLDNEQSWRDLAMPYVDDVAQERRKEAVMIWRTPGCDEILKKLMKDPVDS